MLQLTYKMKVGVEAMVEGREGCKAFPRSLLNFDILQTIFGSVFNYFNNNPGITCCESVFTA